MESFLADAETLPLLLLGLHVDNGQTVVALMDVEQSIIPIDLRDSSILGSGLDKRFAPFMIVVWNKFSRFVGIGSL